MQYHNKMHSYLAIMNLQRLKALVVWQSSADATHRIRRLTSQSHFKLPLPSLIFMPVKNPMQNPGNIISKDTVVVK